MLLLPFMYRYTFSFTLKLLTTLLEKLPIFHIWNVKQNDDKIDQNTLHCCYDEYDVVVMMNMWLQISKL